MSDKDGRTQVRCVACGRWLTFPFPVTRGKVCEGCYGPDDHSRRPACGRPGLFDEDGNAVLPSREVDDGD